MEERKSMRMTSVVWERGEEVVKQHENEYIYRLKIRFA